MRVLALVISVLVLGMLTPGKVEAFMLRSCIDVFVGEEGKPKRVHAQTEIERRRALIIRNATDVPRSAELQDFDRHQRASYLKSFYEQTPALLFAESREETLHNRLPVLFSREYDWHLTPPDFYDTDLLLSFGTNSGWDFAVRKNTKALVLADSSSQPLIVHEMLLRPLIMAAESRAEFFSFLTGVPIREALGPKPEKIFAYFNHYEKNHSPLVIQLKRVYLDKVLERLIDNPWIRDEQLVYISHYFDALLRSQSFEESIDELGFGPIALVDHQGANLYRHLEARYNPDHFGFPKSDLRSSAFASEYTFNNLQKLMTGKVYYLKTSVLNVQAYNHLALFAREKGLDRVTVAASNSFETAGAGPKITIHSYGHNLARLFNHKPDSYLTVHYTTGQEMPFSYHQFIMNLSSSGEESVEFLRSFELPNPNQYQTPAKKRTQGVIRRVSENAKGLAKSLIDSFLNRNKDTDF